MELKDIIKSLQFVSGKLSGFGDSLEPCMSAQERKEFGETERELIHCINKLKERK